MCCSCSLVALSVPLTMLSTSRDYTKVEQFEIVDGTQKDIFETFLVFQSTGNSTCQRCSSCFSQSSGRNACNLHLNLTLKPVWFCIFYARNFAWMGFAFTLHAELLQVACQLPVKLMLSLALLWEVPLGLSQLNDVTERRRVPLQDEDHPGNDPHLVPRLLRLCSGMILERFRSVSASVDSKNIRSI